jgi:putative tributyrin esterase
LIQQNTYKTHSQLLGREINYCAFLPENLRTENQPIPVLYLLHGLFGRYDNWLTNTNIVEYAEDCSFAIICPDGGDSWYADSWRIENHFYESWFTDEFVPHVEAKFNIGRSREKRAVGGLSMGGYGAFKFAFRRPQMFSFAAAMSGAFHAAEVFDDEILRNSIFAVFGDDDSLRNENDLFKIIENYPPEKIAELPFFYFDCGADDGFLPINQRLHELLRRRKIAHEFKIFPGGHDWDYWNIHLKEILKMAETRHLSNHKAQNWFDQLNFLKNAFLM